MTEQLISVETAKLAKEKGFKPIKASKVYIEAKTSNGKGFYGGRPPRTNIWGENAPLYDCKGSWKIGEVRSFEQGYGYSDYSDENREYYLATTQSLLQKWLREKHKLQIEIALYHCHGKWLGPRYSYIIYKICETEIEWESLNGEATQQYPMESALQKENSNMSYEEALEVALFEALKLVP
jgi:hypothetical protein